MANSSFRNCCINDLTRLKFSSDRATVTEEMSLSGAPNRCGTPSPLAAEWDGRLAPAPGDRGTAQAGTLCRPLRTGSPWPSPPACMAVHEPGERSRPTPSNPFESPPRRAMRRDGGGHFSGAVRRPLVTFDRCPEGAAGDAGVPRAPWAGWRARVLHFPRSALRAADARTCPGTRRQRQASRV